MRRPNEMNVIRQVPITKLTSKPTRKKGLVIQSGGCMCGKLKRSL